MRKKRSHYDNLQIMQNASPEVIKGAYKYLSQKYHPDKYSGSVAEAERVMRIINRAYEVLSDPVLRRNYDEKLSSQRGENVHTYPKEQNQGQNTSSRTYESSEPPPDSSSRGFSDPSYQQKESIVNQYHWGRVFIGFLVVVFVIWAYVSTTPDKHPAVNGSDIYNQGQVTNNTMGRSTTVGMLALQGLDPIASAWTQDVLGANDVAAISRACNWPDQIRDIPAWEWSAPQHYVNIPRSASQYNRQRDCPDGLCITEAIKKYADQLGDPRLDRRKQWQAFAWLCHLVGDLHQPLHAGYRDDSFGYLVEVSYRGERINLHEYWDGVLIQEYMRPNGSWQKPAAVRDPLLTGKPWNPAEIDAWTDESHRLTGDAAYPPGEIIDPDFAQNSWILIRQQWLKAGQRLARILNAVVGEGEIE